MIKFNRLAKAASIAVMSFAATSAMAQEVTLKFHHIWPAAGMAPTRVIAPWCDKV